MPIPGNTYCIEQSSNDGDMTMTVSIWREGERIPLFDVLLPADPDLTAELTIHAKTKKLRISPRGAVHHILSHD